MSQRELRKTIASFRGPARKARDTMGGKRRMRSLGAAVDMGQGKMGTGMGEIPACVSTH